MNWENDAFSKVIMSLEIMQIAENCIDNVRVVTIPIDVIILLQYYTYRSNEHNVRKIL